MIVSGDRRHRDQLRPNAVVVETPLELIAQLEDHSQLVVAVVLAGKFAANRELASFLVESYPFVTLVDGTDDPQADPYLPTFA